jgi:hypothetical protein
LATGPGHRSRLLARAPGPRLPVPIPGLGSVSQLLVALRRQRWHTYLTEKA